MDPRTDRAGDGTRLIDILEDGTHNPVVENIKVSGIKLLDGNTFMFNVNSVDGLDIDDIKILAGEISTDGIGLHSGKNITIDNVYQYVNDDALVFGSVNENIVLNNITEATNHGAMHVHAENVKFTITNLNVIKCGDFFRSFEASENDCTWNITLNNVFAQDVVEHDRFITIQNQKGGNKTVNITNASFPSTLTEVYNSAATGTTFSLNNAYLGTNEFNSTSPLTPSTASGNNFGTTDGLKITFGSTFDSSKVYTSINKTSANASAADKLHIGSYAVPYDAQLTQQINGTTHYPAESLLKQLGYTVYAQNNSFSAVDENGEILVKPSYVSIYGLKTTHTGYEFSEGSLMVTADFLNDVFGIEFSSGTASPKAPANLLKDGGFENVTSVAKFKETYPLAYTTEWTQFNFGILFKNENDVHSGKSALHLYAENTYDGDSTSTRGVAQFIAPAIEMHGTGTYLFEAWIKLGTSATDTTVKNIEFGVVQPGYRIRDDKGLIGINKLKPLTLTNEWQKITYEIEINSLDGYEDAFFFVGTNVTAEYPSVDFVVDDAALYKLQTVSDTTQLQTLLNAEPPKVQGQVFKGWYNTNGEVYTLSSTTFPADLHPEYIDIVDEDITGNVVVGENDDKPASASATYTNGFYLQGAQARVGKYQKTGLRFITLNNTDMQSVLEKAFGTLEYGTLVSSINNVPADRRLVTGADKVSKVVAENIWREKDETGSDYRKYTACVTNVTEERFKTNVAVRPYLIYTDLSGVSRTLYGEQYASNIYDIAVEAYNSSEESFDTKSYLQYEILYVDNGDNDTGEGYLPF